MIAPQPEVIKGHVVLQDAGRGPRAAQQPAPHSRDLSGESKDKDPDPEGSKWPFDRSGCRRGAKCCMNAPRGNDSPFEGVFSFAAPAPGRQEVIEGVMRAKGGRRGVRRGGWGVEGPGQKVTVWKDRCAPSRPASARKSSLRSALTTGVKGPV